MRYLLILLSATLLVGCRDEALLYEKDEFKGRVTLSDGFTEALPISATEVTVYLADNINADPYLYSVKTDKDGVFRLPYQPSARRNLYVVSRFTNSAGLSYTGYTRLSEPFKDKNQDVLLALSPEYPGGILKVKLTGFLPNAEPVSGADVYLFTNKDQATTITDVSPNGVVPKQTTNAQGTAFFL